MTKRPLGRSGISVAPLALGGNVFGWTSDEKTSFTILDTFVDLGFDLIDTANMYSAWVPGHTGGESETIIGNWLKSTGKRDKIVLATKVGMPMGDGSKGLRRDYILQSLDASLRGCQTPTVWGCQTPTVWRGCQTLTVWRGGILIAANHSEFGCLEPPEFGCLEPPFVRSADVQTDLSVDVTDASNDSVPAKDGDNVELWPIPKRPRCVRTSAG
jgi:hypothetical protein